MAIPSPGSYPEQARLYSRRLPEVALRHARQPISAVPLEALSMAMSNGSHVTVEEGATMVGVGTAIFGVRCA
ncbi:MAG: hypothetical protein SGJ16_00705 [Nitrospirota bacterium]|nr:hypothetical protein [Nitrospirota bacterium]